MHTSRIVLLTLCIAATLALPLRAEVGVKAESLGDMPDPAKVIITDITPSGHDIIMVAVKPDGSQNVFVNGKSVASDPDIRGVALSPDGRRFAYVAYNPAPNGTGYHIVADGISGPIYDDIAAFDPGAKHFTQLLFSPDAKHLAYFVKKNDGKDQMLAVVDGKEEKPWDRIDKFTFSRDGHWGYLARNENDEHWIVDGKVSEDYPHIPQINDPAFVANFGEYMLNALLKDARDDATTEPQGTFAFSSDGKHYAYVGRRRGQDPRWPFETVVIVDGHGQAPSIDPKAVIDSPPTLRQVALSPDGNHLAYVRFDSYGTGEMKLIATPRGQPMMAASSQPTVVYDGHSGPVLDELATLIFSPDSAHLGYAARVKKQWQAIIDNNPGPLYNMVSSQISFSADGKHFAYAARKDGQWHMVLDGTEIPDFIPLHERFQEDNDPEPPSPGFRFSFDPDGTLLFIASKASSLYRIHATPTPAG